MTGRHRRGREGVSLVGAEDVLREEEEVIEEVVEGSVVPDWRRNRVVKVEREKGGEGRE